jgi:hypothetical protein
MLQWVIWQEPEVTWEDPSVSKAQLYIVLSNTDITLKCLRFLSLGLHNVSFSPVWVEHVIRMMEMRNTYKILVGKPERKRSLED